MTLSITIAAGTVRTTVINYYTYSSVIDSECWNELVMVEWEGLAKKENPTKRGVHDVMP